MRLRSRTKPGTQGTHNFEQWNKFIQKTKNATAFEIAGKLSSEEKNSSAKLIEYVKEIISNETMYIQHALLKLFLL